MSTTDGPRSTAELQATMVALMSDQADRQARYAEALRQGGFAEIKPGVAVAFSREDVQYIARHEDAFSAAVELNLGNTRPVIPLCVDGEDHLRYRKILDPLFSAKRMEALGPDITRRVRALIDGVIERGECNFTEEIAELLPSSVLLGLLGLPDAELRNCLDLRDGLLHPERVDPLAASDADARAQVVRATGQRVYAYFGDVIDDRARHPGDDLLTQLVAAPLSREEILDVCYVFVLAGLDTVTDAMTCLFAYLAQNAEHRRLVAADPSVIPQAVEELLRWESPVPGTVPRLATCAATLPSGADVEAGMRVVPYWAGANLDPATVEDPMVVRFDRVTNPHFAFGAGVHRCLGSHLARRELRIALEEWHRRIPEYWLKPGHEELRYLPSLRQVVDLTLAWR
jgi:cytochrome P450